MRPVGSDRDLLRAPRPWLGRDLMPEEAADRINEPSDVHLLADTARPDGE